jgi:hypothetical protein
LLQVGDLFELNVKLRCQKVKVVENGIYATALDQVSISVPTCCAKLLAG